MFTPIPFSVFEERTGIPKSSFVKNWGVVQEIVSLRQLTHVESIQVMPLDYLKQLLMNVCLEGGKEKPYEHSVIITARMDPCSLAVGQTFIQRDKYRDFLENFQDVLSSFCVTKGIAKCTALIIFGQTGNGVPAIAHYLPPIVEENAGTLCLLDGIHRNFLVKMVGTTLESIIVKEISRPFPCELHDWSAVQLVDAKPPKEKRFFGLREELFRDLKAIGVDG
ncbi:MAG: hypothetical protein HYT13_00530 [Candidatus Liptonbacteria bacterium]|nr:hypothetical protein [Candidatus Liptonbacteria bacterium]